MKVAIVTGSNKGVGFGAVKALCQQFDGDVYLTARDKGKGKAAVSEIQKLGLKPKFHQLDIDDQESINRLRDFLKKEYGGLDVLINNAAIREYQGNSAENAVKVVNTNYFGTLNVCHALFPLLRPHARVVNVSSAAGHLQSMVQNEELKKRFADPNLTEEGVNKLMNEFIEALKRGDHVQLGWPETGYRASKLGLSAISFIQQKAFDKDPREDIVVNAVHPGFVDTDLVNHKGPLTIEQGAVAPVYLALLPPNVKSPRGEFIWHDKQIVDWLRLRLSMVQKEVQKLSQNSKLEIEAARLQHLKTEFSQLLTELQRRHSHIGNSSSYFEDDEVDGGPCCSSLSLTGLLGPGRPASYAEPSREGPEALTAEER